MVIVTWWRGPNSMPNSAARISSETAGVRKHTYVARLGELRVFISRRPAQQN